MEATLVMNSPQAHQAKKAQTSGLCPGLLRECRIVCHTFIVHEKCWRHDPSVTGKEQEAPWRECDLPKGTDGTSAGGAMRSTGGTLGWG